jgi:hypothetical protein
MSDRDPRITIEFDVAPAPFGKDTGFRNRPIWLRNIGGTDAFKAQVQKITLQSGCAKFQEISHIRPDDRTPVVVNISGPTGEDKGPFGVHDLELLMKADIGLRSDGFDWSAFETDCHIFYEDYAKRRFVTHATLSHDLPVGLTIAKNYRFFELKLSKPRRFAFLKWPKA